jgi:hypothetical protein
VDSVIEGGFLLISSNRGYENDAFLEAFAVGVEHGIEVKLFGLVDEGRVVAQTTSPDRATDARLLTDLNDHSGRLRFIKKATPCSLVGKVGELDSVCDTLNSALRSHAGRDHAAVRLEGIAFSDPKRAGMISRIMAGPMAADLRTPEVVAYLYLGEEFLLAGLVKPLPVPGVENGPSLD